jgi:hypothetical protein
MQGQRHAWSSGANVPAHLVALEEIRAFGLFGSQHAADQPRADPAGPEADSESAADLRPHAVASNAVAASPPSFASDSRRVSVVGSLFMSSFMANRLIHRREPAENCPRLPHE